MKLRKSDDRGHFTNNWLNSKHTFSFSNYYNPEFMNFSLLRVLNDDIIAPYQGFGLHPHKNMEIITFMLSGAIEHKDNLGNQHILEAGNVQLMRAGTGIIHSEINPLGEPAHLLQIWIFSEQDNLKPGWWEKSFTEKRNTVLIEPTQSHHSIVDLNSSLSEHGLTMEQQGYVLAIHDKTILDFKQFGKSDVYIHLPKGSVNIQSEGITWELSGGDALYEYGNDSNIEINIENEPVLVFIFPK